MKKLVYIYLVLSVSICFSQTHEKSIFIQELKQASVNKPDSLVYKYELAKAYSVAEELDSAFKYLFIATKYDSTAFIIDSPDFYNLTRDERWNSFLDYQMQKIEAQLKFTYKYKSATKILWTIGISDQAFYDKIAENQKLYGVNCKENNAIWIMKLKINAINLYLVEDIIKKHGWPKYSEFGTLAGKNAFLVIQHSSSGSQKKYLPLIEEACKNNEAEWSSYAYMKDRSLTEENKEQIYGTQLKSSSITGKYEFFPIFDEINVNKRRKNAGLEPIEGLRKSIWNCLRKAKC
jgi:hypothetical protein